MFEVGDTVVGLATFTIVLSIFAMIRRNRKKESDKRRPPSIPALPFIGSAPFIGGNLVELPEILMRKSETLGPVFHFYVGRKLAVVLNGKDAVIEALQRHPEAFADRDESWIDWRVGNVNHKGLILTHYNDAFKRIHKLTLSILKEFGFGNAKETETRICEEVEVLVKELYARNGEPFHPKYTFAETNTNITMKILFGRETMRFINPRKLLERANEYGTGFDPLLDAMPVLRFIPKYRKLLANQITSHANMLELLKEAIKHAQSEDSEINFVKRYIEIEGPGYDRENLLYVLRDLILGSSDTISSTLQWALIELANHPEVQIRLQKEIDDLIPESRLPSIDDKPHLPYTEAVILESMRRHTLLPFTVPHMTLKDTEVCGYHIPRGCLVFPSIYSVHMNPKVWIDPENFRPERFLDKENNVIGREMILSFGVGKRSCIGEILARQTLFLLFTSIVQHFTSQPPEGQSSIKVKEECKVSMRPLPFDVRLVPRKKN